MAAFADKPNARRRSHARAERSTGPSGDSPPRFAAGRESAIRAIVGGFERALAELHPLDVEEREWITSCLADARAAAGLSPSA